MKKIALVLLQVYLGVIVYLLVSFPLFLGLQVAGEEFSDIIAIVAFIGLNALVAYIYWIYWCNKNNKYN